MRLNNLFKKEPADFCKVETCDFLIEIVEVNVIALLAVLSMQSLQLAEDTVN